MSIDEPRTANDDPGSPAPPRGSVAPPGFATSVAEPPSALVASPRRRRTPALVGGALLAIAAIAAAVILLSGGPSAELQIARAINLHASDLAGWTAQPTTDTAAGKLLDKRAQSCPGTRGLGHGERPIASADSPQFMERIPGSVQSVQSSVDIQGSSQAVANDLALYQRVRGTAFSCFKHVFDGATIPTNQGVPLTFSNVQVTDLPVSATGAGGTLGIRITMTMSALGRLVPATFDFVGLTVGRDELSLEAYSFGQQFPAQTEDALAALLVNRALSRPH